MSKNLYAMALLMGSIIFSGDILALQPFNVKTFEQIKTTNLGKPWMAILWSVDCPPCYQELALIQKLRSQYQLYPIVIINVDDSDEVAQQRLDVIAQFLLEDLPNYFFPTGQKDKLQYTIDPHWYGELPRSYYVDATGKFYGKSGLMKEHQLKKLLVIN